MKKWLIFAVIAVMFMVMFPACGGDEGDDAVASDVLAYRFDDGTVLITWNGSTGTDYVIYYQKKGETEYVVSNVKGQRLLQYEVDSGAVVLPAKINDSANSWSVFSGDSAAQDVYPSSNKAFNTLILTFTGGDEVRFGVGPANTGLYSLRSDQLLPIKWDEEDDAEPANGAKAKDWGYITFP
jgi:hypothetical protein